MEFRTSDVSSYRTRFGVIGVLMELPGVGTFDAVQRNVRRYEWEDITISVASIDDIITSKETADRAKDRRALDALYEARDRLREQPDPYERVNPEMVGADVRGQELEWWTQVRSAFPDMVFSVGLLIEKDDLIVSNWTVRGTHTGTAFYDVEPSGEPVEINGTAILRMRDGKIVEHWGGPHCQGGLGLIR